MQVRDFGTQNRCQPPTDGQARLNGHLRVRHAVLTVLDPASGDEWVLHDVDWLSLRLAAAPDNSEAQMELSGVVKRDADGVAVTLTQYAYEAADPQ